jgi:O-antigen/teichoic acid export membrane protein
VAVTVAVVTGMVQGRLTLADFPAMLGTSARVCGVVLPIIAVGTALGMFAAVPRGHDKVLLLATGAGGVTNLLLALPLATRFGAEGMAVSVVLAETVVVGILAVWYLRQPPLGAVRS